VAVAAGLEASTGLLKLERMDISGFKSFGDRTSVVFRDGITAVVGPNGCGKSNIGDALNWVLGEQSPKTLRGRFMADVIFNGTANRKATGLAEVSLHLRTLNGAGDREILLTRRLFRSGDSEYLLNGAKCRLKDIQEILRTEHVGAKTYATIEQGRIDQIVNAKPKEIRAVLEDAAGISGFKHKRRLTELKLEATEANLLRVTDIISEVRRQINSLKRQASKARRYQKLREELRHQQKIRFAARARALERGLAELRTAEGEGKTAEASAAARLSNLEADLAAARQALDDSESSFRERSEAVHRLEIAVNRDEGQIQVCKERIAEADEAALRLDAEVEQIERRHGALAESVREHAGAAEREAHELDEAVARLGDKQIDLEAVDTEVRDLRARLDELRGRLFQGMDRLAEDRNRRRALEEALETGSRQRARLEEEHAAVGAELEASTAESRRLAEEEDRQAAEVRRLEGECAEIDEALKQARLRHAELAEAEAAARGAEESAVSRLSTLEDVSTRFAGVSDGVRALLTKGAEAGIRTRGVIADYVRAGRDIEDAAEVYLEGLLPTVILEDDADARRAVELLRAEGAGRTSFVCRTQPAGAVAVGSPSNGNAAFPETLLADRRVIGRLRDRLSLHTSSNGVLGSRIGDAVVVENLESALELHRSHPDVDFLTTQGEVVYASGIVMADGKGASDRGLLAHTRRTHEAGDQLERARTTLAEAERAAAEARVAVDRLENRAGETREALETARRRHVELGMRVHAAVEEVQRHRRRLKVLEDETASAVEESARLRHELEVCARAVADSESTHRQFEQQHTSEADAIRELEARQRELAEAAAGLRADVAARRQRREAATREADRLAESLRELRQRLDGLREEAARARRRSSESGEELARLEGSLTDQLRRRERVRGEVLELERTIDESRRGLGDKEKTVVSLRGELETIREQAREAEMARARAESDRQHLDELCQEELGLGATAAGEEVVRDGGAEELEGADADAIEEKVADLRGRIERIGPVNIMAIEEFSELEERHEFLSAQRDDLDRSMTSLKETIRKINRTSRERFTEAFEAIRGYYQETFQSLFRGGRADLRMDEDEDVLEAGIHLLAQPPGKRLSSVQLLSGGERAMSAIALLFAIFRFQPSPFCLLDEVDAPLDEVNVSRFTNMLRDYAEHTQFVIITHNKVSMEAADLLYGVTMEEAGVSKLVSIQLS
jgi:chromosome segregation protein